MPRLNTALTTSLLAVGLAGAVLAPGASAAKNNGAYAKSSAAYKASQSTCDSMYSTFETAVDKGLAADKAGDTVGRQFYTTVAEIMVDQLHKGGCEGF